MSGRFVAGEKESLWVYQQLEPAVVKQQPDSGDVHTDVPLGSKEKKLTIVPPAGPQKAAIAFVGGSPSKVEAARCEPFVGPNGMTLNERYLKPLKLKRDEVLMLHAVPTLLTNAAGIERDPSTAEVMESREWLLEELRKQEPRLVVALGRKAGLALGKRADFVLPHPVVLRRFADSGELDRKLRQIQKALNANGKADTVDALVAASLRVSIDPDEGNCPIKFEVTAEPSSPAGREFYAQITKADADRQLIYGVVLEPHTVDSQEDTITPEEIEQAAHRFLAASRVVGKQHGGKAPAEVVESYIAPESFSMNGQPIKKGTWVMTVHVTDPALWQAVKDGKFTGFSIGGVAQREPVQ